MNDPGRDALIRAALAPAHEAGPPAGLGDVIHDRIVATPQRSKGWLGHVGPLGRRLQGVSPSLAPAVSWLILLLLLIVVLALAVFVGSPRPATFDTVLTYHGDAAQTGSMPGPGPDGAPVTAWTQSLAGPMTAFTMPIVRDGVVITADTRGTITFLDESSGVIQGQIRGLGPLSGTPVVAGDLLVVTTDDGQVVAFDPATRVERWRTRLAATTRASLAVAAGSILVGADDGMIHRLAVGDGSEIGSIDVHGPVLRSPAVVDATVFAVADGGWVTAFDADADARRWQASLGPGEVATPAVSDGVVFVAHGDPDGASPYELVALDAETGARVWRWKAPTVGRLFVGAVGDGAVFALGEDGSVYRIDAVTGQGASIFHAAGALGSLAAIVDTTLYVPSADGFVHALDARSGRDLWSIAVDGSPSMPVVIHGRVIVGTILGKVVSLGDPQT